MKIIIDNNILFSIIKPDSTNAKLFDILNLNFIAPEFIIKEFEKYEKECFKKSKLTKHEFQNRKTFVFNKINFIPYLEYQKFIKKAIDVSPDKDDSPYFALAIKENLPIWTNDKALKNQNEIKIISTSDFIDVLL